MYAGQAQQLERKIKVLTKLLKKVANQTLKPDDPLREEIRQILEIEGM